MENQSYYDVEPKLRQALEDMREECAKVCREVLYSDDHANSDQCDPNCHADDIIAIESIKIE